MIRCPVGILDIFLLNEVAKRLSETSHLPAIDQNRVARLASRRRECETVSRGAILVNVSVYLMFTFIPYFINSIYESKYGSSEGTSEPDILC